MLKRCSFVLGEDIEEERTLEEQRRAVMDKYKYKRRQVNYRNAPKY